MSDDNVFKIMIAAITSFFGYVFYGIRRNNVKHDQHTKRLCEHDKRIAVSEEQLRHIVNKLDDVIRLGIDLKDSNKVILKTLARKSK